MGRSSAWGQLDFQPLSAPWTSALTLFRFAGAWAPPSDGIDSGWGVWDGERPCGALLAERAGTSGMLHGPVVVAPDGAPGGRRLRRRHRAPGRRASPRRIQRDAHAVHPPSRPRSNLGPPRVHPGARSGAAEAVARSPRRRTVRLARAAPRCGARPAAAFPPCGLRADRNPRPAVTLVALAGGTGAAKLLRGLARLVDPRELTVVINTGDDAEIWGLHVSPDLDTVAYTLAGQASTSERAGACATRRFTPSSTWRRSASRRGSRWATATSPLICTGRAS